MKPNFYQYQRDRTRILLIWGLANVGGGAVGSWLNQLKFWKQFWGQALGWGAIDALIAVFGLRGVSKKLLKPPSQQAVAKDIRFFHRLLFINAFLDVGYIVGGLIIRQRGSFDREVRAGIGAGFVVQGFFLLVYDALLAREVKRRWL